MNIFEVSNPSSFTRQAWLGCNVRPFSLWLCGLLVRIVRSFPHYDIQKSHNIAIVAPLLVYPQGVTAMFSSLMILVFATSHVCAVLIFLHTTT